MYGTLLSVPQVCQELGASVVFNSSGAVAYKNDSHTDDVFNGLKDYSFKQNKPPLLTATLNNDSLYELDNLSTPVVCKHTNMDTL